MDIQVDLSQKALQVISSAPASAASSACRNTMQAADHKFAA
jgi:hypothetical protein